VARFCNKNSSFRRSYPFYAPHKNFKYLLSFSLQSVKLESLSRKRFKNKFRVRPYVKEFLHVRGAESSQLYGRYSDKPLFILVAPLFVVGLFSYLSNYFEG
jgi:hypothetical protein